MRRKFLPRVREQIQKTERILFPRFGDNPATAGALATRIVVLNKPGVGELVYDESEISCLLVSSLLMFRANDLTGKAQPGKIPVRTFPLRAEVMGAL